MSADRARCGWVSDDPLYVAYHDEEWGVPSHDDRHLFEMLILEGAQAGLSWITILRKRAHYRKVYDDFDPTRVARFSAAKNARLLADPGIVRNRLKVEASVDNARAFLRVQEREGSFDRWLWAFVDGEPVRNRFRAQAEVPARTELSDRISKALKKEGFRFVGSTIVYAYLQAVGVVDDHIAACFRSERSRAPSTSRGTARR
ncbi:MAG: DNA-3-methyladenine glycosylase I [Planctomycetota bacterium]